MILCSCYGGRTPEKGEKQLIETRIEEIFDMLEMKDRERLSDLFSQVAKTNSHSFDEDIKTFFDQFDDTELSYDKDEAYTVDDGTESGKYFKKITVWYHVTGKKAKYRFFFVEWVKNESDPQTIGLYTLRIVREEDAEDQFINHDQMELPGVYFHPGGIDGK